MQFLSFILGNSCTMAFKTGDWEKHLKSDDHAVRFFDNEESLGGICQKLQVLDSIGAPINNVLIIVDINTLRKVYPLQDTKHLYSAEVAGISYLKFQLKFLQEFLYPSFMIPYIDYLIRGKYTPQMNGIIHLGPPIREPYTNNFINPREAEIEQKGELYWTCHQKEFKPRPEAGKEEEVIVSAGQIRLLRTIRSICDKHRADLKFILSPYYYQKKMNSKDIEMMKNILGKSAVWDFTGINEYTMDIHNYYEPEHYRPVLGVRLLEKVYNIHMGIL